MWERIINICEQEFGLDLGQGLRRKQINGMIIQLADQSKSYPVLRQSLTAARNDGYTETKDVLFWALIHAMRAAEGRTA